MLIDADVTSDELCKRGLPGTSGAENELLTRTRDQVVKKFGPNDDLRLDVEIFFRELSYPLRPPLSLGERKDRASRIRPQAECLREFAATRLKEAKKLRRLRKLNRGAAGQGGEPASDENSALLKILVLLHSSQQKNVFSYLWKHPITNLNNLHNAVCEGRVIENASLQRNIQRLSTLLETERTGFSIECSGEHVTLKRPDK
ncbi:MAG: hypothetical protein ACLQNE_37020 [Thermoguttaceae bacterium]